MFCAAILPVYSNTVDVGGESLRGWIFRQGPAVNRLMNRIKNLSGLVLVSSLEAIEMVTLTNQF